MLIALDKDGKRVESTKAVKDGEYFCPVCGSPVIPEKGNIKGKVFSHPENHPCRDSWYANRYYDMTGWHDEWESRFPVDNREILIKGENESHLASVMIGQKVYIFRFMMPNKTTFDEITRFYYEEGLRPVWIIDASGFASNGFLEKTGDFTLAVSHSCPPLQSNEFLSGSVEVWFELDPQSDCSLIQVYQKAEKKYKGKAKHYDVSHNYTVKEFLREQGLKAGKCPLPDLPATYDEEAEEYCREYGISLNRQQKIAMTTIDGANLVLAVPGSGKTTVLVARLGYMVMKKGIAPESILAITYNKAAALEMQDRFAQKFGDDIASRISFRTINALSLYIYRTFCRKYGRKERTLITDGQAAHLIFSIYKETEPEKGYVSGNDIEVLRGAFSYIKNMMIESPKEMDSLFPDIGKVSEKYRIYQTELHEKMLMDFDDQMVFAHWVLSNSRSFLEGLRNRFRYISVDEAQDTSKIQHSLIELLSKGGNLFMVGDEDQSIYGFRAAWPEALMNFTLTYPGSRILRMERNYRSTPEIIETAQRFIEGNTGRIRKSMVSVRKSGDAVKVITVINRNQEYKSIAEMGKERKPSTAVLYRDNESAVVPVDMFLRNNIPFTMKRPENSFFDSAIVKDIKAFLKLSLNDTDTESFRQICNKGVFWIKGNQRDYAMQNTERTGASIYSSLSRQMKYVEKRFQDRAVKFRRFMERLEKLPTFDAICDIAEEGYEQYVKDNGLSATKIDTLRLLAHSEPDKRAFLERLEYLEEIFTNGVNCREKDPLIFSTIHSSKGQEYSRVFIIDAFEGVFPGRKASDYDTPEEYMEERRLFYVGMTRAKDSLTVYKIMGRSTPFCDEILPICKT